MKIKLKTERNRTFATGECLTFGGSVGLANLHMVISRDRMEQILERTEPGDTIVVSLVTGHIAKVDNPVVRVVDGTFVED